MILRYATIEWVEELPDGSYEVTIDMPYQKRTYQKEAWEELSLTIGDQLNTVFICEDLNDTALTHHSDK